MQNWLKQNLAHILTFTGLLLSAGGLILIGFQLIQVNEHKRWENYNDMNLRYYEWYSQMPEGMNQDDCVSFNRKSQKIKTWARTYFDLYGEEYWLYLENLMPQEMWTKRIDGGVDVNLISYPTLVHGYEFWKNQGAFKHPEGFTDLVDKKIAKLKAEGKLNLKKCIKRI